MYGAVNPASIATSISIGTALLTGFVALLLAMRAHMGEAVRRDTAVTVMFAVSFLLLFLNIGAATLLAVFGLAYLGLVKGALLLTAGFAVAGIAFGAARSLRGTLAR